MFNDYDEKILSIIEEVFPKNSKVKYSILGGMTNKNYLLNINNEKYVLRLPGAMTSHLISRNNEMNNSILMSQYGFNVETVYFNPDSGIKITKFLNGGTNLTHDNIIQLDYLSLVAMNLFKLHNCNAKFDNNFNVFDTFYHYFDLLKDKNKFFYFNSNIKDIYNFFVKLSNKHELYQVTCPCHNDLVPENILINKNKLFFIDWEYSGMNTPLFDIAAFFLESRLSIDKQKYFMLHYDPNLNFEKSHAEILIHQFTQDVLWFLWTLIKEENTNLLKIMQQ